MLSKDASAMQCNVSKRTCPNSIPLSARHLAGANLKIGYIHTALCKKGSRQHTQVCQPLQIYICRPVQRHECKAVLSSCVLSSKLTFVRISISMSIITPAVTCLRTYTCMSVHILVCISYRLIWMCSMPPTKQWTRSCTHA